MQTVATYLISLEKDVSRRHHLAAQFPEYYPQFIHIPAIDGRLLSAIDYFNQSTAYTRFTGRIMSPAELGCTLSHMKALESFLSSTHDFALILEDDIMGADQDIAEIYRIAPMLDPSALLICGGQQGIHSTKYIYGAPTSVPHVWKLAPFSKYQVARTCCYLLRRTTAEQLLHTFTEQILLADDWGTLCNKNNIDICFSDILEHPTAIHANYSSHIDKERENLPKFKRKQREFMHFLFGTNRKNMKYLMPFTKYQPFSKMMRKKGGV